ITVRTGSLRLTSKNVCVVEYSENVNEDTKVHCVDLASGDYAEPLKLKGRIGDMSIGTAFINNALVSTECHVDDEGKNIYCSEQKLLQNIDLKDINTEGYYWETRIDN